MVYKEILNISDFDKKTKALKNFYINNIKACEWLSNDEKQQFILFKDHYEIKLNGNLHNLSGPAIKWKNGVEKYWIDGKYFSDKNEWSKKAKILKRKKILKSIL